MHIGDVQAKSGGGLAVYVHVDVTAAGNALGKNRAGTGNVPDDFFDVLPYVLDHT